MSNIDILTAELAAGHPDTGAYSADDATAADELNAVNRSLPRTSMSGDEIFNTAVPAEMVALPTGGSTSVDARNHWLAFCARSRIDPFAAMNVQFVIEVFGAASGTVAALQLARLEPVSRGVELALGVVKVGHVEEARR
jgi:hypothetical protein